MFGLERKFKIELIELSKTFKSLQTNLHPDKFVNARQQNIAESENWSAAVNLQGEVGQARRTQDCHLRLHLGPG